MNIAVTDMQAVNTSQMNAKDTNDEPVDLTIYFRTLKRGKWLILLLTFFSMLIGGIAVYLAEPVYLSTTKILADPYQPDAESSRPRLDKSSADRFYETQHEIIQSLHIAEMVVDRLGLVEDYKISKTTNNAVGNEPDLKARIRNLFSLTANIFSNQAEDSTPYLSDEKLREELASVLIKNTEVSGGNNSQLIKISSFAETPEKAALLSNTFANVYIQFSDTSRLGSIEGTKIWLSEQLSQARQKLKESESRLIEYRSEQGLVEANQQQDISSKQLLLLNDKLIEAQSNLKIAEDQYLAVKNAKVGSEEIYSSSPVINNETVSQLVRVEAALSQRVDELTSTYLDKHPKLITARSELASAKVNLDREVVKIMANIETRYRLAQFQVSNIEDLIESSRKRIQSAQTENFSLVSLERELDSNRQLFENLQERYLEARGKSEFDASNIRIIDRATEPSEPFKPKPAFALAFAAFTGMFLSTLIVLLREALDNTFRTPDELEKKLSLPNLGITELLKKYDYLNPPEKEYINNPRSTFSEHINTIRTGLQLCNLTEPPKSVLVTSAAECEGKSTLAINLALASSHEGKTLLLEADLRRPSIANTLGINKRPGLSEFLTGPNSAFVDILQQDTVGNLTIVTSGYIPNNPVELLKSEKFLAFMKWANGYFDHIIVDAPPTLPVTDSCILANKVDAVVFAVKAEATKSKVAEHAVTRLRNHHANISGAVLTCASIRKLRTYGEQYDEYTHYDTYADLNT